MQEETQNTTIAQNAWVTFRSVTFALGLLYEARFVQITATGKSYDLAVIAGEKTADAEAIGSTETIYAWRGIDTCGKMPPDRLPRVNEVNNKKMDKCH